MPISFGNCFREAEYFRHRVYCYFKKNDDKSTKFIADHFMALGVAKATIYRIINRYEAGIGTKLQSTSKIFYGDKIEELKDKIAI